MFCSIKLYCRLFYREDHFDFTIYICVILDDITGHYVGWDAKQLT